MFKNKTVLKCKDIFDATCKQYNSDQSDNPIPKGANAVNHPSALYADYLYQRMLGKSYLLLEQQRFGTEINKNLFLNAIIESKKSSDPTFVKYRLDNRIAQRFVELDTDVIKKEWVLDSAQISVQNALRRFMTA